LEEFGDHPEYALRLSAKPMLGLIEGDTKQHESQKRVRFATQVSKPYDPYYR